MKFREFISNVNWDKRMFFGLLVLLIFIPIYPKFPLATVAGTYVAIRLEDVIIAIILAIWLKTNYSKVPGLIKEPIVQAFLLFWAVGLLSVISGVLITQSVRFHLGFLHWLRRVEDMSLFLVVITTLKNRFQFRAILISLLVTVLIVSLYGFGQIYLKFPVISTNNREFSKGLILTLTPGARPNSTFAGHYDLAAFLSVAVIFLGSFLLYVKSAKEKLIIAITGLSSFILLALTTARLSFVAAFAGLALSFWLLGRKLLIGGLILLAMASIVAIPSLRHRLVATFTVNILGGGGPKYQPVPGTTNNFTPFAQKYSEATNSGSVSANLKSATPSTAIAFPSKVPADIAPGEPTNYTELDVSRSFNIRKNVEWPRALRAFGKNLMLGTGYSSLTIATDNDFLRALGETGILGLLALVLVFVVLFKKFIGYNKIDGRVERVFVVCTICGMVAFLITGLFIDLLEASKVASLLWLMVGISWVLCSDNFDKV